MDSHQGLGETLPLWSVAPFVGVLLSIAIIPLVNAHFWERHMFKIILFWSFLFLAPFGMRYGGHLLVMELLHILVLDYLPFIVLLFGLFAVSGGIILRGTLAGTPKVNLGLVLAGTLLASWIGTTGASMLLIRPLIRANQWREKKAHVVIFFIFLVSNIGGCLTPIGDPPLFLGFLRGVPFFWTMRLLPMLAFIGGTLLTVMFILDTHLYRKEVAAGRTPEISLETACADPHKLDGLRNLVFLGMIVGSVILSGNLLNLEAFANPATREIYGWEVFEGVSLGYNTMIQMAIILLAAFLSMKLTPKCIREDNFFTWDPLKEVAKLFLGIFITLIPALILLDAYGAALGLSTPLAFFWTTGGLSSFLDNAPTYLVFLSAAGSLGVVEGVATTVGVIPPTLLMAISAGAVFMGANTYIGNAPNFMVKAIAEENHVKMPSFLGYMGWSACFLLPLFVLTSLIFFR